MKSVSMDRKRPDDRFSPARSKSVQRIFVLVLPHVHAMDLAGPVQVFYEANGYGAAYELHFCGVVEKVESAQGFWISNLEGLPEVTRDDWVLVPGIESSTLTDMSNVPVDWLRMAADVGARLSSICSGSWVLAHAGVLDHRRCATHWKIADQMEERFPTVQIVRDRLFVRDGNVVTSAGMASGVDLALSMVEEDHGPRVASRVAREMVVYLRRNGSSAQRSIFVEYRTHLHPGVHRVQDWLIEHPEKRPTVDELARLARMSPRHLTRVFRQATGVSLKAFATQLKLEVASNLLRDRNLSVESVAARCGFADARQLRRLWAKNFGLSPTAWKTQAFESVGD